jgi:hypothetical protein
MVKSHFSRRARFLVTDTNTEDGFDAYPCEVPQRTILRVNAIKDVIDAMYDSFDLNPAPEECTQKEADLLTAKLDEIFGGEEDGS